MHVTFNFFAQVRQAAGVASERVPLDDGADTGAALSELAGRLGDDFRVVVLDESGIVRPSLLMLVNGELVRRGEPRRLADGDEVSLISAVAGG